jgi:hypothetical protein
MKQEAQNILKLANSFKARNDNTSNELIPWNTVLIEKLIVVQLVKKFSFFYGARKFIAVFTKARHWTLSSAR